jgi:hypothetical protein
MIIGYLLLLVFVMAVILVKIVQKEKVHPGWYCTLCALMMLLILWFITVHTFVYTGPQVFEESIILN